MQGVDFPIFTPERFEEDSPQQIITAAFGVSYEGLKDLLDYNSFSDEALSKLVVAKDYAILQSYEMVDMAAKLNAQKHQYDFKQLLAVFQPNDKLPADLKAAAEFYFELAKVIQEQLPTPTLFVLECFKKLWESKNATIQSMRFTKFLAEKENKS